MKKRILCIEDEAAIRAMIRFSLEREGYAVQEAADARVARDLAADQLPDLMLVDWMLPDLSGPELIRRFRRDPLTRDIPIIMLTAKSEEDDMIHGLDAGADDYLIKPVSLKALSARIKALLRRSEGFDEQRVINAGRLQLNQDAHQLRIDGTPVHLGTTEYRLLEFFMQHPEKVYSRAQLLDFVWGQNTYIEERTVDVHVLRLRKTLKTHAADNVIQTIRGAGYLFSGESTGD
ncbi:phosphate regulon transcriptional regulator PhoB [Thiothrix fructosivorans]|uniref:Phosphate regulon transcriptional regulatory protein PhoB n=1 Tax=Thiothrix fructosivorans TaxID=111770 RepID=A0A8B0SIH5_9GAMM|nr:phosphate regulon transcriptional regulator PhoB [Thiothrix fructosivorans]MBO0614760.1 phosphate regulon transcriptional regulator PhoB [Thiothrix fructosivorans]QTX09577.1 phosphate regulon transcriptional regulator PhoB [Thiothrix fructosivorans]